MCWSVLWIHERKHLPELQGREPQAAATGATMEKVGPKPAVGCRSPVAINTDSAEKPPVLIRKTPLTKKMFRAYQIAAHRGSSTRLRAIPATDVENDDLRQEEGFFSRIWAGGHNPFGIVFKGIPDLWVMISPLGKGGGTRTK